VAVCYHTAKRNALRRVFFLQSLFCFLVMFSGRKPFLLHILVVNTFMQLYGGRIEIESKSIEEYPQEHGTTVTLVLKNHAS
jgi:hypothetical protein